MFQIEKAAGEPIAEPIISPAKKVLITALALLQGKWVARPPFGNEECMRTAMGKASLLCFFPNLSPIQTSTTVAPTWSAKDRIATNRAMAALLWACNQDEKRIVYNMLPSFNDTRKSFCEIERAFATAILIVDELSELDMITFGLWGDCYDVATQMLMISDRTHSISDRMNSLRALMKKAGGSQRAKSLAPVLAI